MNKIIRFKDKLYAAQLCFLSLCMQLKNSPDVVAWPKRWWEEWFMHTRRYRDYTERLQILMNDNTK